MYLRMTTLRFLAHNRYRTSMILSNTVFAAKRFGLRYKSSQTDLLQHIRSRIKLKGPITIADYMKEVLTNPASGYYMHRDVFGQQGDFITSPEISQMFGELIGVWCVNEWMRCGSPQKMNIIELGPGRGTLSDDILRVCSQFEGIRDAVTLHLVEVSPKMMELQRRLLTGQSSALQQSTAREHHEHISAVESCRSRHGSVVHWHRMLSDVPQEFSFIVAHEFFDALPIHKFQKRDGMWREVLVDVDDDTQTDHHLRFVLAPTDTAASKLLLKNISSESRDHIELCPDGAVLIQQISERIVSCGGFALIADYGHSGEKGDTFRAFKDHKLFPVLQEPGSADLTADVNFLYYKNLVSDTVRVHGPISQATFLHNMGIQVRLQMLLKKASDEQQMNLLSGYRMLTDPQQMGDRFKFLALLQPRTEDYTPAGFVPL